MSFVLTSCFDTPRNTSVGPVKLLCTFECILFSVTAECQDTCINRNFFSFVIYLFFLHGSLIDAAAYWCISPLLEGDVLIPASCAFIFSAWLKGGFEPPWGSDFCRFGFTYAGDLCVLRWATGVVVPIQLPEQTCWECLMLVTCLMQRVWSVTSSCWPESSNWVKPDKISKWIIIALIFAPCRINCGRNETEMWSHQLVEAI